MYKVIVLDDSKIGRSVTNHFDFDTIIAYSYSRFNDGEMLIELKTPVDGDDVIIISSFTSPVNESLMKLLICADTLRMSYAKSITLFAPYMAYSRQDRRTRPWQSVTSRLVADLIQEAGISRIITFDLHAPQIEGFYKIPIDNIPIQAILGQLWRESCLPYFNPENDVVVSPDHGGVTKARAFMNATGVPHMAIINKYIPKGQNKASLQLIGDLDGKNALIIDDLVDTGETLINSAKALKDVGAQKVFAFGTHALFSKDAIDRISKCKNISKLVVTNTIDKEDQMINNKVIYLDLSNIVIGIIETLQEGKYLYDYLSKFADYDSKNDPEFNERRY